jgi:hypothetical protein
MAKSSVRIAPGDVKVGPTGKVTISNKKLAASLKAALGGKAGIKLKPGGTSAFLDVNFGC